MQGNILIRLVGYVLAQGSPSVQMTVRDEADERVWWDGMPRRPSRLAWASVRHDEHKQRQLTYYARA